MKDKGLTIWKDQHEFSPCNFEIINWKQEMRKSKLYSWRVSSWYNTKFSCLLEKVMYGHWWRELLFNSWEFTGEINWTVTIWEMNNYSRCTQFCHSLLWIKEKNNKRSKWNSWLVYYNWSWQFGTGDPSNNRNNMKQTVTIFFLCEHVCERCMYL